MAIDLNRLEPFGETRELWIAEYQRRRTYFRQLEASGNPIEVLWARVYWVVASQNLERLGVKVNMHAPRRKQQAKRGKAND